LFCRKDEQPKTNDDICFLFNLFVILWGAADDRQEMKLAGYLAALLRARIFKRLWSPGIHSKASIPPA
jgi:hypothetical protein